MPPKKQQEDQTAPVVVWNVLPVVIDAPQAIQYLKKPVNIKKTIDLPKMIEILKEKGVEKYISEGKLTREGELFLSQNLQTASQEFLAQMRKPADPKKDQKKESKKDSKKEEVPAEQIQKTIEFDFTKAVTQFLILLDLPNDDQTLSAAVKNGFKLDVIVWVESKTKQSSRLPDYSLLNKERTIDDFLNQMNSTAPVAQESKQSTSQKEKTKKRDLMRKIKELRMGEETDLENLIIVEVPFLKDLQHPENDGLQFLNSLFKQLCQITINRQSYDIWRKSQQVKGMVPTIKQTVKRQVVIEEKKQDKKGGKKDAPPAQVQTQIVQEVIQKKYQSEPHNIRSDLVLYRRISDRRKRTGNVYLDILQNLALSVSNQTEKQSQVEEVDYSALGKKLWQKQGAKPVSRITVGNLQDQQRSNLHSRTSELLTFASQIDSLQSTSDVSLKDLLKYSPGNSSLQMQYQMKQFTNLLKQAEPRSNWSFHDRKYVERLDSSLINSEINIQLQYQPTIYSSYYKQDDYKLIVLARVNPPGRVIYRNFIFDWQVVPNFQFWSQAYKDKGESGQSFYDYNWRECGNLKILNKKMMPTDNTIITESSYSVGDKERTLVTLVKDDINYGLKRTSADNFVFWKIYQDLRVYAFTENKQKGAEVQQDSQQSKKVQICIQREQFTVVLDEATTVFWSNSKLQAKRSFTKRGQIIKYMKDSSLQILYLNGDISTFSYGKWKHIKDNKVSEDGKAQNQLKVTTKIEGEKTVKIREDGTIFVSFSNGDSLVGFKDNTTVRTSQKGNKIQILNEYSLVIRIKLARNKDFNIIGSGSAFAYLGQKNLLQRSYDGYLSQLHHPTFTAHYFQQKIDKSGDISIEDVRLLTFTDGSIIKMTSAGLLTFLHKIEHHNDLDKLLHERWLQLFTTMEYHHEGVYDVNLFEGWIRTKDGESNQFKVQVDGPSQVQIAVSFNINNQNQQKNHFGTGFHVPEQNYFLPPPSNCVLPRLFLVFPDGSGAEFLSQQQISSLSDFRMIRSCEGTRNYLQFSKQNKSKINFMVHSFTESINLSAFEKPHLLQQIQKRINLVPFSFPCLLFRNIEEVSWNASFSQVDETTQKIRSNRLSHRTELQLLRSKAK